MWEIIKDERLHKKLKSIASSELDLSNHLLTSIPTLLLAFQNLTQLVISVNSIETMDGIERLISLVELDFSYNTSVSQMIGALSN